MRRLYYFIYAVCLILFGLLGYSVHQSYNFPSDSAINLWFKGIALPPVDSLMQAVSDFGETIPAIITVAVVAIVLLFFRRRLEAAFVAILPSLAILLNLLLKVLIDRPRPGSELLDNGGLSFPSGHVTYAVVFFSFLFYLLPKLIKQSAVVVALRSLLIISILLISVSRVYLGEHWASDVLGSLLLGGLLLVPAIVLYKRYAIGRGGNARAS
jgi:membrane-associated phospholipid phosphatase